MKNKKEVEAKILRLQLRLEQDKEGIKDNLGFAAVFGALIPASLRVAKVARRGFTLTDYISGLAQKYIAADQPVRKESWMEKIKRILGIGSQATQTS